MYLRGRPVNIHSSRRASRDLSHDGTHSLRLEETVDQRRGRAWHPGADRLETAEPVQTRPGAQLDCSDQQLVPAAESLPNGGSEGSGHCPGLGPGRQKAAPRSWRPTAPAKRTVATKAYRAPLSADAVKKCLRRGVLGEVEGSAVKHLVTQSRVLGRWTVVGSFFGGAIGVRRRGL